MRCNVSPIQEERSLEAILKELRRKAAGAETPRKASFNSRHGQFIDRLRSGDWISVSKLPDNSSMRRTLVQNGWIERRTATTGVEYRITKSGLAELCLQR